jgi:AraC-like DNA-binding protein
MLEEPLPADALSAALMKMKLRAFVSLVLDAGGNWGIDFPGQEGLTLNVVQRGECWLVIGKEQTRLRAGDCFLLTGGKPFTIGRDVASKRRHRAEEVFARMPEGVVTCGGGGDVLIAGTVFRFEGHLPRIVLGRLPPVIHIAGDSDQAAVLRWSLERFGAELRGAGVGRSLMLNHLAPIMLLQTLRIYLQTAKDDESWLSALSDPRLAKVLGTMHSAFEREWSLEEFANLASMSRSGFALTFKKKVGVAPMDYLASWRMQAACERLQESSDSVAEIARAVGYASESAFSAAFVKIVKCRPGAYRSGLRA